jgi:thiamine biosynthesis protein ThiS
MNVKILANGKMREIPLDSTVGAFIESLGLDAARTIVELDGEPLERNRFEDTKLAAGARIEIAQMVGGG